MSYLCANSNCHTTFADQSEGKLMIRKPSPKQPKQKGAKAQNRFYWLCNKCYDRVQDAMKRLTVVGSEPSEQPEQETSIWDEAAPLAA
jgi:hypothetical protein